MSLKPRYIYHNLSFIEDIRRNVESEGQYLYLTDTKLRKYKEQRGLENLVVYIVNDGC